MQPITYNLIGFVSTIWILALIRILFYAFRYTRLECDKKVDSAVRSTVDMSIGATVLWLVMVIHA